MNPQTQARRYLLAGKRAGLPKSWADRWVRWLQRQVDVIWAEEGSRLTPADAVRILGPQEVYPVSYTGSP